MTVNLKQTQVDGKKYALPEEEVEVQKLVKRGLSLEAKVKEYKDKLEGVKLRLTEIAKQRRNEQTTVKLKGITGTSVVTFRESWEASEGVETITQELGTLWDRFFSKAEKFKTSKDLKQFMEGKNDYGLEAPEQIRDLIGQHVKKKTIKPNVKLTAS